MKTYLRCAILVALAAVWAAPASAGDLKLSMQGGRVTIIAHDVPLRQILQEWARVGNTQIVNGDKVPGAPMTLELVNVPEAQALDTLLRTAAGYMAAARPAGAPGASVYDRVMILATSRAPAASAVTAAPPQFQPRQQQMPVDDDDEPINPPVVVPSAAPNQVVPFPGATPPNPNVPAGQQPPVLTSPRPGALPTPTTPNGVPNPYQPSVVRPVGPGGPGSVDNNDNNDR